MQALILALKATALYGCVYLKERLEHEKEEAHLLEKFDIPLQVMDQTQVHELEPALLPQVVGGIYYPRDGHINPHRFVIGLAEKAQESGRPALDEDRGAGV